ncbi:7302_t:CDS:2, partial [Racocetra persica]
TKTYLKNDRVTEISDNFPRDPEFSITNKRIHPSICKDLTWTEQWISTGAFESTKYQEPCDWILFDIVYTWVNGSDDYYKMMKETYEQKSKIMVLERYYRNYDELRYSIRSVETFFKNYINKIYIIVTDLEGGKMQIPTWLNTAWKNPRTGMKRIEIIKHSDIFTDITVLPTFNSLAIESQIMNIPNLSDQIIYFNDDLFLGQYLTPSDFWTPLYGPVFHIEPQLLVSPNEEGRPIEVGEWYALHHTNKLLSERFGYRHRAYVSHSTHTLSTSILREIAAEWPQDFHDTSSHRFRGELLDIHTTFLFTHYVIEKHRESLLKSFLIWKMDKNHNGRWELSERQEILKAIRTGKVRKTERKSLTNYSKILNDANLFLPYETSYIWSSMDGYPNLNPRSNFYDTKCKMDFNYCFGKDFMDNNTGSVPIDKIFRELAFNKYGCGDCIISSVISLSGESGLEAFLPPSPSSIAEESNNFKENNLNQNHKDNNLKDNNLNNNLKDNNLKYNSFKDNTDDYNSTQSNAIFNYREYAVNQISRFNYVIGDASFSFVLLKHPHQAWYELNNIINKNPSVFCINDDVDGNNPIIEHFVKKFLKLYFRQDNEYELDAWERKKSLWLKFKESIFKCISAYEKLDQIIQFIDNFLNNHKITYPLVKDILYLKPTSLLIPLQVCQAMLDLVNQLSCLSFEESNSNISTSDNGTKTIIRPKAIDHLSLAYSRNGFISNNKMMKLKRLANKVIVFDEVKQQKCGWDIVIYEELEHSTKLENKHVFREVKRWNIF